MSKKRLSTLAQIVNSARTRPAPSLPASSRPNPVPPVAVPLYPAAAAQPPRTPLFGRAGKSYRDELNTLTEAFSGRATTTAHTALNLLEDLYTEVRDRQPHRGPPFSFPPPARILPCGAQDATVTMDELRFVRHLGEGAFAMVDLCLYVSPDGRQVPIAVKVRIRAEMHPHARAYRAAPAACRR